MSEIIYDTDFAVTALLYALSFFLVPGINISTRDFGWLRQYLGEEGEMAAFSAHMDVFSEYLLAHFPLHDPVFLLSAYSSFLYRLPTHLQRGAVPRRRNLFTAPLPTSTRRLPLATPKPQKFLPSTSASIPMHAKASKKKTYPGYFSDLTALFQHARRHFKVISAGLYWQPQADV
ncbi:hypothetical protein C8Q79DRAFT_1011882 [Trametes meyenii]|nr:hypothetical protein C8Q79DRAFT_1011882 [Trametes meyenii]